MLELKDYQKTAVKKLKTDILEMLKLSGDRQKIIFKAPTGAGKTVMASALLDELNMELRDSYNDVAFIWIAPNKLHVQSYMSMRNFFSEKRTLKPVMFHEVNTIDGMQPGEVLFLNWESINKENAVMIRDNEQNRTLYRLTEQTKQNGIKIIVIIDEEHMFGGRNAKKSELVLSNLNPKIELRISATPTTGGCTLVNVPREQVIAEEMIKKGIQLNPQLKGSLTSGETVNQQLLEQALHRREMLARALRDYDINPLLLIQLPNDNSDTLSVDEKNLVEEITTYLDIKKGINIENEKLAVWLSGRKENVSGIEKRNNMTEVLLFKQAIALGWDCPRAAVLLIFRDIKSQVFTAQTVGRILRMPEQRHYTNDALNYGYVYTNLSADMISIVADDMSYVSTIYAKRRENINNITLPSVYQNRRKTPRVLMSPFKRFFRETVVDEWKMKQRQLTIFKEDGTGTWADLVAQDLDNNEDDFFTSNRNLASKNGIRLDVARIMVKVPKDLNLTGEVTSVLVEDRAKFARTQGELLAIFNQFCRKNVGDYEPGQSAEMIRSAIYEMMEDDLGINQNDAIKVVLYHANRPKFEALLQKARDRYSKDYEKREREREKVENNYVDFIWELPETRMYNTEVSHSCDKEIFNHALVPYFEERMSSEPERLFSRFLDQNNEVIDWWYKNGDKGNMHFAIPYTDKEEVPRCFYVDYIIRLKNGTVCLFDTKSQDSDPNAPHKHNALLEYISVQNKNFHKRLMGGVIIRDNDNWYYSPFKIENTSSLDGWTALDLNNINVVD